MKASLLFLVLASAVFADTGPAAKEEVKIECRGVIEEVVKDGFQGQAEGVRLRLP